MRLFFLHVLLLPYFLSGQTAELPALIPAPVHLEQKSGECRLDRPWKLNGDGTEVKSIIELLGTELSNLRNTNATATGDPLMIDLNLVAFDTLVPKGYYGLQVNKERITLQAPTAEGLFLGTRTLIQLLETSRTRSSIACMNIIDHPRFGWRGMHLDVCRHFFPIEFVKKYIDLLARYKMNSFHWHLTEDQGWRIEIKKYPKLTEVGAWRSGSQIGPYSRREYDSIPYGGFYTQEQIREVVAYAQARHINVVPEIEMPGHAMAALAAYPELSCTGGLFEVQRGWGVFEDVFCPKEETFTFLENVLSEVMELFPSEYIHIGGDECPKERWKTCAHCQALIKEHGLKDEHGLQSYFIQRMEKFVNGKGRMIIGWDEILEGGLAPNATVMSWQGVEGGIAAAKAGQDAIMSPGSHCYFDHYQGDPANEPLAIGGFTTVQKVYSYEPVPTGLSIKEAEHILGAQGNVWTEYILTSDHVEYMALPRMAALAEVVWSPKENRNEADFMNRLEVELSTLNAMNVNASKSIHQITITPKKATKAGMINVEMTSSLGTGIYYSIKTKEAGTDARKTEAYIGPIAITKDSHLEGWLEQDGRTGPISERQFNFNKATAQRITLSSEPNNRYNDGGAFTLVDGITAQEKRVNTEWLGWKEDVTITVDLGSEQDLSYVGIGALGETYSWIHLPEKVDISTSLNGTDLTHYGTILSDTKNAGRTELGTEKQIKARFIRLSVVHRSTIPTGYPGAGGASWLFLDEVIVR